VHEAVAREFAELSGGPYISRQGEKRKAQILRPTLSYRFATLAT
jgi:hypothetical protein